MRFHLDHVIIAVRELPRATEDWRRLGLIATDGGTHPRVGTRNAIVRFADGSFLELMAIDDREKLRSSAPALLSLLEQHMDGPFSWALRTDDIQGAREMLVARGVDALEIWPGEGRRDSGKTARWRSFHVREAGFPFVVQYEGPPTSAPARDGLPATGLGAVLLTGRRDLLTRLANAFGAEARGNRVTFDTGHAELERDTEAEPALVGVELTLDGSGDVARGIGADGWLASDPRLHGLRIRLATRATPRAR